MKRLSLLAIMMIFVATGCAGEATQDRKNGAGNKPDGKEDTSNVVLYRNADSIPNVAYFCAGAYGWASTLSGTDAAENKAATIVRFPEYDATCSDEPR